MQYGCIISGTLILLLHATYNHIVAKFAYGEHKITEFVDKKKILNSNMKHKQLGFKLYIVYTINNI